MSNKYIELDGKRYRTVDPYESPRKKSRQVRVGLSGKTLSQTFSFINYRFRVRVQVYLTDSEPYGALDDLRETYAKQYVTLIDIFGYTQEVFLEGELPESFGHTVVDENVPLEIDLNLRKRQV